MLDTFRVPVPIRALITTKTTTTPVSGACYLFALLYNCTNAGTAWSLTIQDKASTPLVIYTLGTLVVSTVPVVIVSLTNPMLLIGGLDIITGGTTAGALNIWGWATQP